MSFLPVHTDGKEKNLVALLRLYYTSPLDPLPGRMPPGRCFIDDGLADLPFAQLNFPFLSITGKKSIEVVAPSSLQRTVRPAL